MILLLYLYPIAKLWAILFILFSKSRVYSIVDIRIVSRITYKGISRI